uniref:Uncharacterized protein n=1 Tax=Ascaris lumbricoides TaxID=6252 RepID=A0A0M3IC73_ASCLU
MKAQHHCLRHDHLRRIVPSSTATPSHFLRNKPSKHCVIEEVACASLSSDSPQEAPSSPEV